MSIANAGNRLFWNEKGPEVTVVIHNVNFTAVLLLFVSEQSSVFMFAPGFENSPPLNAV